MLVFITNNGNALAIYDEAIDLKSLGIVSIRRASHVEPDEDGRWWADLCPVSGPRCGPFNRRSEALAAEQSWLESNRLQNGQV